MKKKVTMLGMSACVLLAFSSCSSTDEGDFESAMPMASDSIADGEMPPWLIDDVDDGGGQIAAGTTTHENYPIPEPEESVSDVYGRGASQNQPAVASQGARVHNDSDVRIEQPAPVTPVAVVEPTTTHIGIPTPAPKPVVKPRPVSKPVVARPAGKNKNKNKNLRKPKRYTEPTMLTYKVRKGDNLSDIAKRSRTTVAQIKKDSKLKGDTIYPGQIIKVRYIPKGYKAPKRSAAAARVRSHVVAKGETISGIAKKYGIPYGEILKTNGMSLRDASRIRPGKRLNIPAAGKKSRR
ncbi:MAG: LysM peptidoglycan-binding domain-containing protein [Akkermansia sp.]|nr:LysM peptidoglycan-binding domain-containing protein [Akkermansia sp.]